MGQESLSFMAGEMQNDTAMEDTEAVSSQLKKKLAT